MRLNLITLLLVSLIGTGFSSTIFASNDDTPTSLEVSDPDYPGASFDEKIEIQKKLNLYQNSQLTLDQQNQMKETILRQNQILSTPYTNTATPVTRSLKIKFDSGLTPPIIRLSANMLTTLVFTDSQGNPWNITSVAVNKTLFSLGVENNTQSNNQASQSKDEAKPDTAPNNILSLEPLTPIAYGNIAITLDGLDTPVILMLSAGQKEVDMRVDARISGLNPNRTNKGHFGSKFGENIGLDDMKYYVPTSASANATVTQVDDMTLLFVDGTPPKDAELLKVSDHKTEAWLFDNETIVRTNQTVLYPAYSSAVTSASGITVYRFPQDTQNIVLSGNNGQPQPIYLEQQQ